MEQRHRLGSKRVSATVLSHCTDGARFFMFMREDAYQIPLNFVMQYWRPFLALDDEGPLLLHPQSGHYALFGPNGYLSAGLRR